MRSNALTETKQLISLYHNAQPQQVMSHIHDYLSSLETGLFPDLDKVIGDFRKHILQYESESLPRYQRIDLFPGAYLVQETSEFKNLTTVLDSFTSHLSIADQTKEMLVSISSAMQIFINHAIKHPLMTLATALYLQSTVRLVNADSNIECSTIGTTMQCTPKNGEIQRICQTQTLTPYNILPHMTMGAANNIIQPASCVKEENKRCADESSSLSQYLSAYYYHKQHFNTPTPGDKMRIQKNTELSTWQKQIKEKTTPFFNQLSNNDSQQLMAIIVNRLNHLKQIYNTAKYGLFFKAGNCGEHTFLATTQLIKYFLQTGKEIKMQVFNLLDNNQRNLIADHQFLMLDSNMADIEIKNNALSVKKYLESVETGLICDPWNNGKFELKNMIKRAYTTAPVCNGIRFR